MNELTTIEKFRQLRKQLAPVISIENERLMPEVEKMAGADIKTQKAPAYLKKSTITHNDRVNKHLKLN